MGSNLGSLTLDLLTIVSKGSRRIGQGRKIFLIYHLKDLFWRLKQSSVLQISNYVIIPTKVKSGFSSRVVQGSAVKKKNDNPKRWPALKGLSFIDFIAYVKNIT